MHDLQLDEVGYFLGLCSFLRAAGVDMDPEAFSNA